MSRRALTTAAAALTATTALLLRPEGAWIGLSPRHGRSHLVRSVMEGVSYGMRDSLELIRGLGVPIRQIHLSGGGAKGASRGASRRGSVRRRR